MSTDQNKNKNEEEVDLGSLFLIIGKGFSNFFNFIGNIFKGIFHFLITVLIFFKDNFVKIIIAGVIGLVIGLFIEFIKPVTYNSELLVEPNFESTKQLYNNINYYNNMVQQEEIAKIEETFNVNTETAESFKKFEIEPVIIENDILEAYDDLILSLDSLVIINYDYEMYQESLTEHDYRLHKINVISKKNNVFKQLEKVIISNIIENTYFNRSKELSNENLNRSDSLYRKNLTQIESLRKVYLEVMLEEARKQTTGTNIDLGGGEKRTTKELELFETGKKINSDLRGIANQKARKYNIINVVSSFQPIGSKIKGLTNNYAFLLSLLTTGLMIVFLLLTQLNTYLINYKK